MASMADFITPEEVKAIQHELAKTDSNYGGSSQGARALTGQQAQRAISRVRRATLGKALEAVQVDCADVRGFWAHGMAVFAGRHFFPDANHRTGRLVCERVVLRACRMECSMRELDAEAMVNESKDERQRTGRLRVKELSDEVHPYRSLFYKHLVRLRCQAV